MSRRRRRELGFETLEDRRVMSAQSPAYNPLTDLNIQSYSSDTPEGQAQILANELYWQALLASYSIANSQATTNSIPTDPLLTNQWHLINTGQSVGNPDFQPIFAIPGEDINVGPVWNQNIFGNGVVVAVIDTGVQTLHPDLAANIHPTLALDPLDGDNDPNPNLFDPTNAHGTAVAGLIGAVANNGQGGTGVAPGVQLVPIRLIDVGQTEQAFIDAFRYTIDNDIDITNNSWGPVISRGIVGPTDDELLALRDSVIQGRDGLGVIHIFSSGNSASVPHDEGFPAGGELDSSTYNGWVTSRYTIGVTGVDHDGFYNNFDGTIFSYAEAGPNVLVAAPTGSNFGADIIDDTGLGSGIWTTDTLGDTGFNETGFIADRDFLEDTDYSSRFNGTSAAAPLVSGVVALMLEANPNLSWRDVQEILVRSARQNAEFDSPIVTGRGETQNTWIVNQMDLFHDPDIWDPSISPFLQTLAPTLDPLLGFAAAAPTATFSGASNNHYNPRPSQLTNGAGYTVSQGIGVYGEEIGYAHGVVDAELAVQLAQQWSTKSQTLPAERTYTSFVNSQAGFFFNLPAREQGSQDSGFQYVPGGLGGLGGFVAYWNEYFVDDPDFSQDFNARGGYVNLTVPANNTMTVENVEVKLNVTGDESEFLQNVRVVLVSPDGTHHEMNDFFIQDAGVIVNPMNITPEIFVPKRESGALAGLTTDTTPDGPLVVTFSSNRSWGERSDSKYLFDPTTKEPITTALQQGWQLHFENYSGATFEVQAIEVAWHGAPIAANTFRLQGLVGIDDDQNNDFNFGRVDLNVTDIDGDAATLRYGEVANTIDLAHESMAANVTVVARRASDGAIVDRFVTGADGNYYFDLVPDDYILSIEDPENRVALEDTLSPSNVLQHFRTEWTITEDFFRIWDYDQNLEVAANDVGGVRVPQALGGGTPYHVKDINFLLDPGAPVTPQVQFSGTVIADLNGDGIFNNSDVNVPSITVYADANRNGQLDPGEVSVLTNATGQYNLVVGTTTNTVINVGVIAPPNWVFTDPTEGFSPLLVEPGDVFAGIDFSLTPPVGTNPGNGSTQPGYLIGSVYEDLNTNGSRQAAEQGVSGLQVYIDANNNGTFEVGEVTTTTNSNGAFVFANVAPGTHRIRIVAAAPLVPINPAPGNARLVTLSGGGSITGIEFGIGNTANQDFGDLPALYAATTSAQNGARHGKSQYFLGTRWDAELDGTTSNNADADDLVGDDEDGVVIAPLVSGATGTATVTASRHGGVLQGWVDFNGDGDFSDSSDLNGDGDFLDPGEFTERIFTNVSLAAGVNNLTFQIPATLAGAGSTTGGVIYARFRYGEYGINSITGAAVIGEVEDYVLERDPSSLPAVIEHGPDFDEDGDVDGRDMMIWQRNVGRTNALGTEGDANGDGVVGYNDLVMWRNYYGTTAGGYAAFTAEDEEPAALAVDDAQVSDDLALMTDQLPEEEGAELSDSQGELVEAILIVDTDGGSSYVTEVSAQASTNVTPTASSVAGAVQMWLDSRDDADSEEVAVSFAEEEVDSVFGDSRELADLALALRSRGRESTAFRISVEDWDAEAQEENAFELAFAEEADWRQF